MTTQNQPTGKQLNKRLDMLDRVLMGWEKNLEHLENNNDMLENDEQESFQEELNELNEQLDHIQVRLRSMKEGDPKEWFVGRKDLREKMDAFKVRMEKTAERFDADYQPDTSDWESDYDELVQLDSAILYAGTYEKQIV